MSALREAMEGTAARSEFSASQPAPRSAIGSFLSTAILVVFFDDSPCRVMIRETTFTRQSGFASGQGRKDEDTTTEIDSHLDLSKALPGGIQVRESHPHAEAEASARRHGFQTTQEGKRILEVVVPASQPDAFHFSKRINGNLQPETTEASAAFPAFSTPEAAVRAAAAVARLTGLCTPAEAPF